ADMGTLLLGSNGSAASASVPPGVIFTLTVNQSSPSSQSGDFGSTGAVSGTIAFSPASGALIWTPTTTSLTLGVVTYQLVIDNSGNIGIVLPTPADGQNPNQTSLKANLTVTPEPSTVALMAAGMLALIPIIRRRKR